MDASPAQAKTALLAWADAADRVSRKRVLGGLILAGGAAAVVGCSVMTCIPTSRRASRVNSAERPRQVQPNRGRGVLALLTMAMQVHQFAGPVVMEHLRRRSAARLSRSGR